MASKPIPLRLTDEEIKRLDRAAERTGIRRSSLMKMLVGIWLDSFEANGSAALPLDWQEILDRADGRRSPEANKARKIKRDRDGKGSENPAPKIIRKGGGDIDSVDSKKKA